MCPHDTDFCRHLQRCPPVPNVRGPKADSVWGEGLIGHSENKCALRARWYKTLIPALGRQKQTHL